MSAVNVVAVRTVPRTADAIGLAVGPSGPVPRQLGLNRAALEAHGFTGKVGATLVLPNGDGATLVAVGVGDEVDGGDVARRGGGVHPCRRQARPCRHEPRR